VKEFWVVIFWTGPEAVSFHSAKKASPPLYVGGLWLGL